MSNKVAASQQQQMANALYDMTVVIPVYNKEDALESCVRSLDKQTASQDTFEVILVNDGSSDDSLAICKQLASTRKNYVVIDQENQGVSAARNAGMQAAHGRYLMFLDSDDWISRRSIRQLIKAFDEYQDEVDVLSYPILYHNSAAGKGTEHRRRYWMKESGVYDLAEYPFLAQTTVNVCVKNDKSKNFFSTELKMGEDQLFITTRLFEKERIGFCDKAAYHYIRSASSSSSLGNYPLYAFDGMMVLFEFLEKSAREHPRIADYLYSLIIYNIEWRFKAGMLYPDYGDQETRTRNYARLETLLKAIPLHCWLDNPYLSDNLRLYLAHTYSYDGAPSISYSSEETTIAFSDEEVRSYRIPSLTIDWLVNKHEGLQVRGRLAGPSFVFEDKPRLAVKIDGVDVVLDLKESSYSFDGTKTRITKAWYFETVLPNSHDRECVFPFAVQFGNRAVESLNLQFALRRCNGCHVKQKTIREFEKYVVELDESGLHMVPKRDYPPIIKGVDRLARDFRRVGYRKQVLPLRQRLHRSFHRVGKTRTWIYVDNPVSAAMGNAFIQFLHDIEIDDGVKRLYLTAHKEEILDAYPNLAGSLLEFHSWDHTINMLQAELVLASFIDRPTFMPYGKGICDRIGDFAQEQAYVYLQHGVLHAHMPWYCSYDRTMFDFEVISTSFEEENLSSNYLFPKEALIGSGAPRLDALDYQSSPKQKKIALVPSWRGYLIGGSSIKRIPKKEALLNSSFYKGLMGFLAALNQSGVLERYGYTLDLKLHPNFMVYEEYFTLEGDRVRFAPETFDEGEYAVAITDYSSYLYDFVYAGARIMYFLPDEDEFESGVNHYSKLDLPFEEGFGPYSSTPEEAVEKLEELLKQIESGEGADEYRARADEFFLHHDKGNCDRLYSELMRISKEYVKRSY